MQADVSLLYGVVGAILIGMGLFGLTAHPHTYRKILAWNVTGSGVFLIFGAIARRNALAGVSDPVPQAIVITGIVVSVSATALALAIIRRVHQLEGDTTLDAEESEESPT